MQLAQLLQEAARQGGGQGGGIKQLGSEKVDEVDRKGPRGSDPLAFDLLNMVLGHLWPFEPLCFVPLDGDS